MSLPSIPKGYALAIVRPGKVESQPLIEAFKAGEGCPVLAEAEGPIGIMRALEIRMGPWCGIIDGFPADRDGSRLVTIAVLRTVGEAYRMDHMLTAFHPEIRPRERGPQTWAETNQTQPVHPSQMEAAR